MFAASAAMHDASPPNGDPMRHSIPASFCPPPRPHPAHPYPSARHFARTVQMERSEFRHPIDFTATQGRANPDAGANGWALWPPFHTVTAAFFAWARFVPHPWTPSGCTARPRPGQIAPVANWPWRRSAWWPFGIPLLFTEACAHASGFTDWAATRRRAGRISPDARAAAAGCPNPK